MQYLLEMLRWIQSVRNPALDQLFTSITVLGEDYFAIAVLCCILWCVNKKAGYLIGFAYLTSWICNFAVKAVFRVPRPFVLDREIVPIRPETATGYSFPSGHTQGISALGTAIGVAFRQRWLQVTAVIMVTLMAASRMYLGVHTLLDVTVGAAVGFAWVHVANRIFRRAEASRREALLLVLLIPMALGLVLIPDSDYYKIAGTFTSFLIGYLVDRRYLHYEASGPVWQRIVKFACGMAVLMAIKTLVKEWLGDTLALNYLRYLLIGFWITVAAPWLFQKVFGAGQSVIAGMDRPM